MLPSTRIFVCKPVSQSHSRVPKYPEGSQILPVSRSGRSLMLNNPLWCTILSISELTAK